MVPMSDPTLAISPGYFLKPVNLGSSLFIQLDKTHRVIRQESALEYIFGEYDYAEKRGLEREKQAIDTMVGAVVLTKYSNKFYSVDRMDFSRTAMSTFLMIHQDGE